MARCEICGRKDFRVVATEIREGPGRIARCQKCGLIIQDVEWGEGEIKHYYNEVYQRTNSLDVRAEQTPREHFESRRLTLAPVLRRLKPFLKKGMRVLDVGCGAGELLHAIRPMVKEVVGVEICQSFVDFMNKDLHIEAHSTEFNSIDFGKRFFDLIVSIDALDHLPNPRQTLVTMRRLLAPRGRLYLEVPNVEEALNFSLPNGAQNAYTRFFWHKAHFFYFSKATLKKLFAEVGFRSVISSRHQYTLKNYLNWYFRGKPQGTFLEASMGVHFFKGRSSFERGMNKIFSRAESEFHRLLEKTGSGDTLCCNVSPQRAFDHRRVKII